MSRDTTWKPEWRILEEQTDSLGLLQPWDDKAYQALRNTIDSLPQGDLRDKALERIQSLDCSSPETALASCKPSVDPPPEAIAWRETLEDARVGKKFYVEVLAKTLRNLVCSGDADDAIHVVRGPGFRDRLQAAGVAASGLMDDLTNKDSKDCPVAASLTAADRANLLEIKQKAIENAITEAARRSGFQ